MVPENAQIIAETGVNSSIRLTLLGTGTSQGIPVIGCTCKVCKSADQRDRRLRTAAFLEVNGTGMAIDLGPDFRQQMLVNGFSDVHAVLLTHEHNDHVSGLDDIRPVNFLYQRDIPIYGSARSLLEIHRRFIYAFDKEYVYPGKPRVTSMIIDDTPFEVEGITITPIPVDHGDMAIYGFRVGDVAYITDAKSLPDQSIDLLSGLDVLILNALRFESHPTHLTISEAIDLALQLNPARCFLTHISHDAGLHAEINAILPDKIRLGYDGLRLTSG
jgi:phosphoribosyl 1,2-cyclic phosphate phosphodiesterase